MEKEFANDVDIWNLDSYKYSLEKFLDSGYQIGSFREYLNSPSNKFLVLRHDIDFNPDLVWNLIEIEKRLNVTSSIFLRTCANNYNLASFGCVKTMKRLVDSNFELGLHLDLGMSNILGITENESANIQKSIFESVSGIKIEGFSLHMPTRNYSYEYANALKSSWNLSYHAYDEVFFGKFKYLSDSGGRWREGHFLNFLDKYPLLQVLTHPIWYFHESAQENF